MSISKRAFNNILFFLGVAACVVMLFTFDVSFTELWQHICHAGYWMIPIIGVWGLIYLINAMSWYSVINGTKTEDEHVGFLRVFRLTITGYALNYATPVGGLGGEPYRILELSRDLDKRRATSSVILYAMMHIFAHFWLWFTSIFLYFATWWYEKATGRETIMMDKLIVTLLAIAFFFCLAAFYLFSRGYKNGLVVKIIKFLGHIPGLRGWSGRFLDNHRDALENVDRQIAALHAQEKRAFYHSFFLEYFSRLVQALEIMFMLLLLGENCGGGLEGYILTYIHSVLILAFMSLFANLIGFLPLQLGVQEGGFVLSIAAMGLAPAVDIFVSIICRVREIIWIAIGVGLMKLPGSDKD